VSFKSEEAPCSSTGLPAKKNPFGHSSPLFRAGRSGFFQVNRFKPRVLFLPKKRTADTQSAVLCPFPSMHQAIALQETAQPLALLSYLLIYAHPNFPYKLNPCDRATRFGVRMQKPNSISTKLSRYTITSAAPIRSVSPTRLQRNLVTFSVGKCVYQMTIPKHYRISRHWRSNSPV
jgi:hypothetical protein